MSRAYGERKFIARLGIPVLKPEGIDGEHKEAIASLLALELRAFEDPQLLAA